MSNTELAPGIGEYGDARSLSLEPGDIVVVSERPLVKKPDFTTTGSWGDENAFGSVLVGEIKQTPSDRPDRRTTYVIQAAFTNNPLVDSGADRITVGAVKSAHSGFGGLSIVRRGVNPPQDGVTTYHLKTFDGGMPLIVTETRIEGKSTFAIAIDEKPSLGKNRQAIESRPARALPAQ